MSTLTDKRMVELWERTRRMTADDQQFMDSLARDLESYVMEAHFREGSIVGKKIILPNRLIALAVWELLCDWTLYEGNRGA